jgi:WD40 repeat protein
MFSPDDIRIVSGSEDQTIQVWNAYDLAAGHRTNPAVLTPGPPKHPAISISSLVGQNDPNSTSPRH